MKKSLVLSIAAVVLFSFGSIAQKNKKVSVPSAVKSALTNKYPASSSAKITWETEKGNYEANWGGKSGEDNSVQFTPGGEFIEIMQAIPATQLPKPIQAYVRIHFKQTKITEAGKITHANGKITYMAEVNKKEMPFDENGNPLSEK